MCQISSLMDAAEGLVAEFSCFANFEEKKRKSNVLMSFPKIGYQMGSFGHIRKNSFFSLLSADSRYFRIYALNWLQGFVSSYSVCNHSRDKQIGPPLRGRPILLSLI